MELSDFIPVIVPYNAKEREIYTQILLDVGLKEPVVVEPFQHVIQIGEKQYFKNEEIIREVANTVGTKKSVIISGHHYPIADCYNDKQVALVTFDAHNDSYGDKDSLFNNCSGNGEFILRRKGKTYIIGTGVGTHNLEKIKTYPPKQKHKMMEARDADKIFLSLDIDVFDPSVTQAHHWPRTGLIDLIAKALHIKRYMDFESVMELTQHIIKDRKVVGVNIAGYDPEFEEPPYKTAELLKQYLSSVLKEINK